MCAGRLLDYSQLLDWAKDDHQAAVDVYGKTVDLIGPDWPRPDGSNPRQFIERHFQPVLIGETPALITGYYEPVIDGADTPDAEFGFPLYRAPAALSPNAPWHSRAEIEEGDLLAGSEIVWLSSAIEAFLAQVQGSVRISLRDGRCLRLGHAGKNGHPYRSVGAELVRRGEVAPDKISSQAIRDWCAANPALVPELLRHNPSFGFFRQIDLPESAGPIGTMGRSVTAFRSVAFDPDHSPLGALVWLEKVGDQPRGNLMVAQDTGSAIKGAQRADVFCGTGAEAGVIAGNMRNSGRIVTFFPHAHIPEVLG